MPNVWSDSKKLCFASRSGTRSCGRRGPASDGSTSPRSSSTTWEYSGSTVGSCQNPFSLQYDSTSKTCASARPVSRRYLSVSSSTGKKPHVAPYSGDMFPIVARSASARPASPGPKYSTNFPTTPVARRICVTVKTRSVAVAPSGSVPLSLNPTTCGISIEIGSPSIAASASIPPTPQPRTPSPFTIVVCESVPTSVSGNVLPSRVSTTRARNSRLTWWTMPVLGGTTLKLSNASWPQRRNAYRSRFRSNSSSALRKIARAVAYSSTCTEWSMTSSTGSCGLIRAGAPPRSAMAFRIAARSTTAGTPVKSCRSTREGRKEISSEGSAFGSQRRMAWASASSPCRSAFSSRIRSVYGSRATSLTQPTLPSHLTPAGLLPKVHQLTGLIGEANETNKPCFARSARVPRAGRRRGPGHEASARRVLDAEGRLQPADSGLPEDARRPGRELLAVVRRLRRPEPGCRRGSLRRHRRPVPRARRERPRAEAPGRAELEQGQVPRDGHALRRRLRRARRQSEEDPDLERPGEAGRADRDAEPLHLRRCTLERDGRVRRRAPRGQDAEAGADLSRVDVEARRRGAFERARGLADVPRRPR